MMHIPTAIIGFGAVVKRGLLPAWGSIDCPAVPFLDFGKSPGLSVVAVCDKDPLRLAEAGRLLPTAQLYTEWQSVLEMRNLMAVVIATPSDSHAGSPLPLSAMGSISLSKSRLRLYPQM